MYSMIGTGAAWDAAGAGFPLDWCVGNLEPKWPRPVVVVVSSPGNCARFACRIPTWRLPVDGHVIGLVSGDYGGDAELLDERSAPVVLPSFRSDAGVDWVSALGGGVKRVRLNRKTPWVWKMLRIREHPGFGLTDAKARLVHQSGEEHDHVMDRGGIG